VFRNVHQLNDMLETRKAHFSKAISHVRLNMYTDGGIARFRVYGKAKSPTKTSIPCSIFDEYFGISIRYKSRSNTTCFCDRLNQYGDERWFSSKDMG
jgi:hypothetical protein